jgi:hypothetical protein
MMTTNDCLYAICTMVLLSLSVVHLFSIYLRWRQMRKMEVQTAELRAQIRDVQAAVEARYPMIAYTLREMEQPVVPAA